jgi:hypothetical protein
MKTFSLNPLEVTTVLKRRVHMAALRVPDAERLQIEASSMRDHALECVVIRLRTSVFGRKLSEISVSYPADWWQAFKDRWFPTWAKKRWPVEMKTERLVSTEEYTKISCPEHDHFVRLYKNPDPSSVYEDLP